MKLKTTIRIFFLSLAWFAVLLVIGMTDGCTEHPDPPAPVVISGRTMGTTYLVKIARPPVNFSLSKLQAATGEVLEQINDAMSTYRTMSEVSRFNRSPSTDWFGVSPETALVVAAAQQISRESGGAFDVTVGPLVNIWGFGPGANQRQVPSAEKIAQALADSGFQNLQVRKVPPALRKSTGKLVIDLSAIAKGYAVDRIAALLEDSSINNFLVEIGGEIKTRGAKLDGSAWTVGIELPDDEQRNVQEVLALSSSALATSGDYRNFFERDGRRYSHTINPRTGRPVTHQLASVTVVADSCMLADGWATALMVLGPEQGYAYALRQDIAGLFVSRVAEGFSHRPTPAFTRLFPGASE
jgi:thiamine biosynthesis lipoprotein